MDLLAIIGPPGSGKTTLAKHIAMVTKAKHLSTGDVARDLARTNADVQEALDRGELAPPHLFDRHFERQLFDLHLGGEVMRLVVDGYPRYLDQLTYLISSFPRANYLVLDVDREVAISRCLARGRPDDTVQNLGIRWDLWEEEGVPIVEWLRRWYGDQLIEGRSVSQEQAIELLRARQEEKN